MEEEERRAETEVYTGDASLGKRALQRVLMRKQLEQMSAELRELMVYQSPKELGALYTEVEEMMKIIGAEQAVVIKKQMETNRITQRRKQRRLDELHHACIVGIGVIVIISGIFGIFAWLIQSRIEMYPQYGTGWLPKSEEERRREALPHVYIGR
jgi:16S rRNA C1402 (ribose-2'-O) methylase RsmI